MDSSEQRERTPRQRTRDRAAPTQQELQQVKMEQELEPSGRLL